MLKPILLSAPQIKSFGSRKSLNLMMAGQGGGKTFMIGLRSALFIKNFPKVPGFIGANTYMQLSQSTLVGCKRVWSEYFGITEYHPKSNPEGSYVVDKVPPVGFETNWKFKTYHNIISFKNGAIVYLGSLDNYKAHDGKEFGWAELDETKDTKVEALTSVILGRLRSPGMYVSPSGELVYSESPTNDFIPYNPCTINTSPALGPVQWLIEMFELEEYEEEILSKIVSETDYFHKETDNRSVVIYSSFHNKHNLPSNYIENRLTQLTENEALKFIYGYPFSKTGGEYYTYFERLVHTGDVPFIPGKPIHLTFDYNVVPYMTLEAAQIIEASDGIIEIRFFDEYCLKSPLNSTDAVCDAFLADYEDDIEALFLYGDASGRNRIPGRGDENNYRDIKNKLEYHLNSASDRCPRKNANPLKRRELLQKIFAEKLPIRILIDREKCPELIKDFTYLKLGVDGKLKEKVKDPTTNEFYEKIGHTSDAAEYLISEAFKHLL